MVARVLRGGKNKELVFFGYKVSILEDEKDLKMEGGDGCSAV